VRKGTQAAIISMGGTLHYAVQAWDILSKQGYEVQVVNVSSLSNLDKEVLQQAAQTGAIITYEDHNINTGLGSLVANFLAQNSLAPRFQKMGIKEYGSSGLPADLFRMQGLDIDSLVRNVIKLIKQRLACSG